jgi:hypothetical protein
MPTAHIIRRDKQLWAAVAAGPAFWSGLLWWSGASPDLSWPISEPLQFMKLALGFPVFEELVFRGGLQTFVLRFPLGRKCWHGVTAANILVSALFGAAHLFSHAPLWAASTVLPSIVFGYFRDRHASLVSPIALHVVYNSGYFWLFGFR